MAFPQYIDSSPYSRLAGAGTHTLVVPTVAAGDFLILRCYHRNLATGISATLSASASWSLINIGTMLSARQYVFGRFVASATNTRTYGCEFIGTGTYTNNADIHIIRGVTLSSYYEGLSSLGGATATNRLDSIVVATGQQELAINLLCQNNALDAQSLAGATGGTWVLSRSMSDNVDGKLSLYVASLTTSGTIDGGAYSPTQSSGMWINLGLALKPVEGGAVAQTVTAGALAVGSGFGGAPIICPVGFIPHPAFLPQVAPYARALWPW